ncbi:MAG: mevalonate kinase [Promethearchaeota archaeon]
MKSVKSTVPGKCILFGEHAVVHGYPAISMPISLKSWCIIEENDKESVEFQFLKYNEFYEATTFQEVQAKFPSKFNQFIHGLYMIIKKYDIILDSIKVIISSELMTNSGLGSSASTSIALISAMTAYYNLDLPLKELNKISFEMEKVTHGNPSGIDNKSCIFGGMIFFQDGLFHRIDVPDDFQILITYTNQVRNTKDAIRKVQTLKKENSVLFESIMEKIGFYSEIAEHELINGNYLEVGRLMNINQNLLVQLNLSNDTISKIINVALKNGAYGSKLTGAGLGGCVISIGSNSDLKKISNLLDSQGYQSFITQVNREGVVIGRKE